MKRLLLLFALSLSLYACQEKVKQQDTKDTKATKEQLEKAMTRYLEGSRATKNQKLHFYVLDVVYYEEIGVYECNFKVKMTLPDGRDTTGYMRQKISKDSLAVMH